MFTLTWLTSAATTEVATVKAAPVVTSHPTNWVVVDRTGAVYMVCDSEGMARRVAASKKGYTAVAPRE